METQTKTKEKLSGEKAKKVLPSTVIHFEVQADNIERAKDFYENSFGWKIDKYSNNSGDNMGMDYWIVVTGPKGSPGINGGMYQRPKDRKNTTYECTIMVTDIDDAIDKVKENGGKITKEKVEMKGLGFFANAMDTEGNTFSMMQPTGWQPD